MINLRIQDKLFISFLIIALLGGVIALINLTSARQLEKGVSSIGHNLDKVQSIMVVHNHVQAIMASEMRLLSRELSRDERATYYRDLEASFALLDKELHDYGVLVKAQDEKQTLAELYGQWQKWRQGGEAFLELCRRLDNTDILDPLLFQNTLFQKKEEAYNWVMTLREAISNDAPFTGAMSEKEGEIGTWLFGLSSQNSSLAVAIGKARKPLVNLYHSARKISRLIDSDQAKSSNLITAVLESETLPAQKDLFAALDVMIDEADKASEIYGLMAAKVEELSRNFYGINKNLKILTSGNSAQAATVIAGGSQQMSLSNRVSLTALPVGLAAIFLLAFLLGKFITRPLTNLHQAIEHFMAIGDFSSKVEVAGNDEIAHVGRSFNKMVDRLHFYYRALEGKNDALGEAQEELSRANEELAGANEELARANRELKSRSHSLEESVLVRTRELALQQEKMVELNARLWESNDKLSQEIEGHRTTLAELQEAKEIAEAGDRAKSAFLANMSHEVRTPMTAILGLTSMALKQEVPAKVHDYLSTVKKSAKGLLVILDDILDFSKIEAGHLELEEINFNLHDVFDNLKALFGQQALDKKVDFEVRIDADVPPLLIGDPLRLGQVLSNLTGNALKFTAEGQVTIMVAVLESKGKDVELLFTVSDTGIGIAESQQEHLFDAFSQADESTSRQFGGTGLGLAISKRIVEHCGGQIWLESVPGQGSACHFTARFDRQVQVDLPSRYKEIFAGSRVLVVDDNKMFRHFMARMFTSFHFEVETAETGEHALDTLREMAGLHALPHVILLDQTMPGMDGLSLVKILGQEGDFAEIPIVMISADGHDIDFRHRADKLGVKAVLSKPVKRELLLSCLEMLLQGDAAEESGEKIALGAKEVLAGHRILLVSDSAINREVASELLLNVGLEVVTAGDGEEALSTIGAGFDAVLMDVLMPKLNGLDVTRQIRNRPEFAGIPIIAMTVRAMKGEREKCLEAGMNGYIAKPLEPEILYQVLCDALHKEGKGWKTPVSPQLSLGDNDFTIPGIDVDRALRRINNNSTLFRKLLDEFVRDNQHLIEDVNSCFQAGEVEKVIHIVHTLKGVAGNLGAVSLQAAAQALENPLRQEAKMPAKLRDGLERRLHEVFAGVVKYTALAPVETITNKGGILPPLPGGKELRKMLITLLTHIEANTPKAERYLQELPCYASRDFEEGRKEVQACLERFDFEAARAALLHLGSELGVKLLR